MGVPVDRRPAREARRARREARAALERLRVQRPEELRGLRGFVRRHRSAGLSDDAIAQLVAQLVDALIPGAAFGPAGVVVEALDGWVAYGVARLVIAGIRRANSPVV